MAVQADLVWTTDWDAMPALPVEAVVGAYVPAPAVAPQAPPPQHAAYYAPPPPQPQPQPTKPYAPTYTNVPIAPAPPTYAAARHAQPPTVPTAPIAPIAAPTPTTRDRSRDRASDDPFNRDDDVVMFSKPAPTHGKAKKNKDNKKPTARMRDPSPSPPSLSTTPDPSYVFDASRMHERAQRFTAEGERLATRRRELTGSERTALEAERVAAALREAEVAGAEVDLNAFVVQGTSEELEKKYLRLTSAPDPATVRPERVLELSLAHVKRKLDENGAASYEWASDQLKAIRQDLTVQHVKSALTVRVYETHARAAVRFGGPDYREFNQSVTQLMDLYDDERIQALLGSDAIAQARNEFRAYMLLYHATNVKVFGTPASAIFLASALPASEEEEHALAVWAALERGDWTALASLRASAPHLGQYFFSPKLMEAVRKTLLERLCLALRPTISVQLVREALLLSTSPSSDAEWTTFCAAHILLDAQNDQLVDAKRTLLERVRAAPAAP